MTVAWFEPCRLLPLFLSAASSTPPPIVSPDPTFSGDAKPGDLDKPTVPSSPSTTTVSLSSQPETIFMDDRERHVEHRVLEYAAAVTDFFGTGIVCIFKTGSPWPARDLRKSPSNFQRETRAVHGHPIGPSWSAIAAVIKDVLDIKETNPTSISPLACANVGDRYSFCPLFIRIGVARTVTYDAAVQAASAIHDVLTEYGFSDVNVALVESHESLNVDSPSSVNEALPLNPAPSDIRQLKKPFTSVPGRPISLLDHPSFEGTGSVCLRLGEGRIGVLTCAHVAGPPPVNRTGAGFTHVEGTGQPPLMVISPGTVSLKLALKAINDAVNDHTQKIDKATNDLTVYGYNPDNPDPAIESLPSVSYILSGQHTAEQARIELQELLNELTAHGYTENASARARMIGFVRHCEQIRCSGVVPDQYTDDWAIVEYFTNVVNQASFIANKIFIGGMTQGFSYVMWPNNSDKGTHRTYPDCLLPINGVVPEEDIRNPPHLDRHGNPCLFVVKDGAATHTTVGCTNGLLSLTRHYTQYGISEWSTEVAVLACNNQEQPFSAPGDSGSIVLDRDGRILGLLTAGPDKSLLTDVSYVTPWFWLKERIEARFPGFELL